MYRALLLLLPFTVKGQDYMSGGRIRWRRSL